MRINASNVLLLTILFGTAAWSQTTAPGLRLFPTGANTCLLDATGQIVHCWPGTNPTLAVNLAEDGSLYRTIDTSDDPTGGASGTLQRVAFDGTLLWEYTPDRPGVLLHHDIEILPNGNILAIAWESKTTAEAIAAGRDPALLDEDTFRPDIILEIQQTGLKTGNIVWEWHVFDHLVQNFDSTQNNFGVISNHPELIDINYPANVNSNHDFNHANSVHYVAAHDLIIFNCLQQGEFWIIDHSTTTAEAAGHVGGNRGQGGDILYRWGNPAAYDAGTAVDRQLFRQHAPVIIPEGYPAAGNLILFNNQHPNGTQVWELELPFDASGNLVMNANGTFDPPGPSWVFSMPSLSSAFASNAERLPNGNTLISSAAQRQIFEVGPNGQLLLNHDVGTFLFHTHYVEHFLWNDGRTLSAATGGTIQFDLVSGDVQANHSYILLGSISGTSPGISLGDFVLPLNPDNYTTTTLSAPNTSPLSQSLGGLQTLGRAKAYFTVGPGQLPASLAGTTLHHAFVAVEPSTGSVSRVSNAVEFVIVP